MERIKPKQGLAGRKLPPDPCDPNVLARQMKAHVEQIAGINALLVSERAEMATLRSQNQQLGILVKQLGPVIAAIHNRHEATAASVEELAAKSHLHWWQRLWRKYRAVEDVIGND